MSPQPVAAHLPSVVVLDSATAARLAPLVRAAVQARTPGTDIDPLVLRGLHALQAAELVVSRQRGSVSGPVSGPVSTVDRSPPAGAPSTPDGHVTLACEEVARLAGVTRQAVAKAARAGRLAGRIRDGHWVFTPAAVQQWTARRGGQDRTGEPHAGAGSAAEAEAP